jgi:multiple sugar transport system substrate-binding protein
MRGGVDKVRAGLRIRRPAARSSRRGFGYVGVTMAGALAAAGLAACGTSSAATGPVTLNFYMFPDPSGAIQDAVNNCSAQSHGKYTISYNLLPTAADQQRLQMARRLAAGDSSLDNLGLDVTW